MSKLLIVESPNKAKTIRKILGNDWVVMASVGHIRDLPKKSMGLEPPEFVPAYEVLDGKQKVVSELKTSARYATQVYLATDMDREGEAIAWHIQQLLRLKDAQRVTFHEITAAAVQKAVSQPRKLDMGLVRAQEGRRVADRLVGYMVSPILGRADGHSLSAGRVQSVAVKLVVEREREIRSFVSRPYYEVLATLKNNVVMKLIATSVTEDEHVFDRGLAEAVALVTELVVSKVEITERQSQPDSPFTTSSLQQKADAVLKMSASDCMKTAQSLFEKGLITYHRTDDKNLSPEGYQMACAWLESQGLPFVPLQRSWKASDSAQEAHEAIRPSDFDVLNFEGTSSELALYRLIHERAVQSQMPAAVDKVTVIEATDPRELGDGERLLHAVFAAKGRVELSPGWRALKSAFVEDEEGEGDEQAFPEVPREGQSLELWHAKVVEKKTRAAKRFTQGTLVQRMEKLGIGRPATYASIISNVMQRGYFTEGAPGAAAGKGKRTRELYATELGEWVIDQLEPFKFLDYEFTNQLEQRLDDIRDGKDTYLAVVRSLHDTLSSDLGKVTPASFPGGEGGSGSGFAEAVCPKCGDGVKRLPSKQKKGTFFWAHQVENANCVKWLDDVKGKPQLKAEKPEATTADCPHCGQLVKRLQSKTNAKEHFWVHEVDPKSCSKFLPDDYGRPGQPRQKALS